jgi:hypothetical protein
MDGHRAPGVAEGSTEHDDEEKVRWPEGECRSVRDVVRKYALVVP